MNTNKTDFIKDPFKEILEESSAPRHEIKSNLRGIRRYILGGEFYEQSEHFSCLPDIIKEFLHKNSSDVQSILKSIDSLLDKNDIEDKAYVEDERYKKNGLNKNTYTKHIVRCKKKLETIQQTVHMAEMALKDRDIETADAVADELCDLQDSSFLAKSLSRLAGKALRYKLYPQALSYAEKAFLSAPNDAIAVFLYLKALTFNNHLKKALEIYEYAMKLFPDDEIRYFSFFGEYSLEFHEYFSIREKVEDLLKRHPCESRCYIILSKLNEMEDNISASQKLKDKLLTINLKDYMGNIAMVRTLFTLGEFSECLSYSEAILNQNTDHFQPYRFAILCCLYLNDYNRALTLAESAYENWPNKDNVKILLADCYSRLNQCEKASEILWQISNLQENEKALFIYAQALRHAGKTAKAFNKLQDVLRLLAHKSHDSNKSEKLYYLVYCELGFLYLREYQKSRKDSYLQLARIQFELASRYIPQKSKTILGLTFVRYEFAKKHEKSNLRFTEQLSSLEALLAELSQLLGINLEELQKSNNVLDRIIQYVDKHRDHIIVDEEKENGEEVSC